MKITHHSPRECAWSLNRWLKYKRKTNQGIGCWKLVSKQGKMKAKCKRGNIRLTGGRSRQRPTHGSGSCAAAEDAWRSSETLLLRDRNGTGVCVPDPDGLGETRRPPDGLLDEAGDEEVSGPWRLSRCDSSQMPRMVMKTPRGKRPPCSALKE